MPRRSATALAATVAAGALAVAVALPVGAGAVAASGTGVGSTPSQAPTTPTPTPTDTTSVPPAPEQPPPPPAVEPVPVPAPSPTGDAPAQPAPTRRYLTEAQAAAIRAELEESDQAVVDAQLALADTDAELLAVTAAVQVATEALARATAAEAAARVDLQAAEQSEAKVGRELEDVMTRIGSSREALGQVARRAYQTGAYSSMSVALEAETPNEFASRLIGVETVVRAENAAIARLSVARADLLDSQQRYRAVRERLTRERSAAASTLAAEQAAQAAAQQAQASLDDVRGRRAAVVAAAEQARQADIAKHADFLAQSGDVGRSILSQVASRGAAGATAAATGAWVKPGTGAVTSQFGQRYHPILHYVKLHTGVDLGVGDGWVYAADAGVVLQAEPNRAYGGMTVIDHGAQGGRSVTTLYGHQASMLVQPGDAVVKGQRIGRVGATGYATGPHLHFEIRLDGEPVDPWPSLATAPLPAG